MPAGIPGRITARRAQMTHINAVVGQTESNERQAQALERIAAVLEDFFMQMYPAPAESVSVESCVPTGDVPMENEDEPGDTSEV